MSDPATRLPGAIEDLMEQLRMEKERREGVTQQNKIIHEIK